MLKLAQLVVEVLPCVVLCVRFDLRHCLLSCPGSSVGKSALPRLQSSNPNFLEKRVAQLVYLPLPCSSVIDIFMSYMSRIAIKRNIYETFHHCSELFNAQYRARARGSITIIWERNAFDGNPGHPSYMCKLLSTVPAPNVSVSDGKNSGAVTQGTALVLS